MPMRLRLCVPSCVWIFAPPWAVARRTPLSMEFSRQEYWSESSFLLQGMFLTQGLNPLSLASPALTGGFFTTAPPGKPFIPGEERSYIFFPCSSDCMSVLELYPDRSHMKTFYVHFSPLRRIKISLVFLVSIT